MRLLCRFAVKSGRTFKAAVQQRLGLKFDTEKAAGQVFTIDHVERPDPN